MAFAAKCAVALLQHVWVQRNRCNVVQAGFLERPLALAGLLFDEAGRRGQVFAPIEVASRGVRTLQYILQSGPCRVFWSKRVDPGCLAFIQCSEVGV